MKLFEIQQDQYDWANYTQLYHPNKSDKDFKGDVKKVLADIIKSIDKEGILDSCDLTMLIIEKLYEQPYNYIKVEKYTLKIQDTALHDRGAYFDGISDLDSIKKGFNKSGLLKELLNKKQINILLTHNDVIVKKQYKFNQAIETLKLNNPDLIDSINIYEVLAQYSIVDYTLNYYLNRFTIKEINEFLSYADIGKTNTKKLIKIIEEINTLIKPLL